MEGRKFQLERWLDDCQYYWRGKKCTHLVSTFSPSATCAQLLCTIKPNGSLGSGRIWYWMGGVKERTLNGVFWRWIALCAIQLSA